MAVGASLEIQLQTPQSAELIHGAGDPKRATAQSRSLDRALSGALQLGVVAIGGQDSQSTTA
jgi:hypothetical protein